MTIYLNAFEAQVDALIATPVEVLSTDWRQRMIKAALERYSADSPDEVSEDEAGDGGRYYALTGAGAVLSAWVDGFSRIVSIEYPAAAVASDETPNFLEPESWDDDYWAAGVRYLRLPSHAPAASESMRIRFTAPYTFSGTPAGCSIPAQDFYAVCNLAASLCCEAIASKYSHTSDSTINADSVDHPSRALEFAKRAQHFYKLYLAHIGQSKDEAEKAAGSFADLDSAPGWPSGRRYLFHGDR